MINNLQGELIIMDSMGIKPNYAQLAKKYGMDWRTVKKYHHGYEGKPKTRDKPSKLDIYKDEISDKLKIKRISMQGVYEFLVDKYGLDSIGSYSNFTTYVNRHGLRPKPKTEGHPRYETEAGMLAQVDWKEDIHISSSRGEHFVINVLHVSLGFSRFSVLTLSFFKREEDVLRCLISSFRRLGGVPRKLLFDNMPTVVHSEKGKRTITGPMARFAKDFGFGIKLCRPRCPETKGTVEARNKIIDWIRAYDGEFGTMDELAGILEKINKNMNLKNNEGTGMSPTSLFYKEKDCLLPLPAEPVIGSYLAPDKHAVSNDALVRYGGTRYSVSPRLIGEKVTVESGGGKLYIYHEGNLEAVHAVSENPVEYMEEHYKQLLIGKAKESDIESLAKENLKIMDKILGLRELDVPPEEAARSEDALIAYMDGSPCGRWVIGQYSHWCDEDRKAFRDGMGMVLPYVANKEAFMERLKFSVKSDCCRSLAFDCAFNDMMAFSENECTLTDTGYRIFCDRYREELDNAMREMADAQQGKEALPDEQL